MIFSLMITNPFPLILKTPHFYGPNDVEIPKKSTMVSNGVYNMRGMRGIIIITNHSYTNGNHMVMFMNHNYTV